MRDSSLGVFMAKRGCVRAAAISVALIVLYLWTSTRLGESRGRLPQLVQNVLNESEPSVDEPKSPSLQCYNMPGGNDTLLILRTGSTELQDRFPVHTSTLLRCVPHYLIFSDYEEDFLGVHIIDALDSVDVDIVAHHQDFELYRRLKQNGRAALDPSELSGTSVMVEGASGNAENPGWKLDKWKFLPMLNRTLSEYPDMKWYVFVEADTFIFWSTLQAYLATQDYTKPLYAGDAINIGELGFAHGGTGFIVSQPALRTLVEYYLVHKTEIEAFTDSIWAGDAILGKTFLDSGVPVTDTYPLMQGQDPGLVLYAESSPSVPKETWQVWCSPTISYHHLPPTIIEDLWKLEQSWIETRNEESSVLRHKDVFKQYVMPQMTGLRDGWDNLSDEEHGGIATPEDCRRKCEADIKCKQYSFNEDSQCKTRINPRLGLVRKGTRSGWLQERISTFEQDMTPCTDHGLRLMTPT